MGAFEVSERNDKDPEKFAEALHLLEANKATINQRFHPEGYVFEYWKFQNRIYRQKLSWGGPYSDADRDAATKNQSLPQLQRWTYI